MSKLRVYLADDHNLVREGLKGLINREPDMEVVGEAADGNEACQSIVRLRPDVAVVDLSMPGMNGAEVVERIRRRAPEVRLLILTIHEDRSILRQVLQQGAAGFLLKRAAASDLISAIRTVASSGTYLDPSLASQIVARYLQPETGGYPARQVQLSERETDVIRLIAEGHSSKEIAARLGLSVKTVETYKVRSMEKLDLQTRADIVRYALQVGLLKAFP